MARECRGAAELRQVRVKFSDSGRCGSGSAYNNGYYGYYEDPGYAYAPGYAYDSAPAYDSYAYDGYAYEPAPRYGYYRNWSNTNNFSIDSQR